METYEAYCRALGEGDAAAESILLFRQRMNELEGELTEDGLISTDRLADMHFAADAAAKEDALTHILRPLAADLHELLAHLRTEIVREDVPMRIHKARELDGHCIAWLSRRPGETVRQKLANSPSILAVRRRMSYDTAENQLVKALLGALADALELRDTYHLAECYGMTEDQAFLDICLNALGREELSGVGPWKNLPPNHALLSDRHYNLAWRAYQAYQGLDELTAEDAAQLPQRLCSLAVLALLRWCARFAQMPVQPVAIDTRTGRITAPVTGRQEIRAVFGGEALRICWDLDEKQEIVLTLGKEETVGRLQFHGLAYTWRVKDGTAQTTDMARKTFSVDMEAFARRCFSNAKLLWQGPQKRPEAMAAGAIVDPFTLVPRFWDRTTSEETVVPERLCVQAYAWTDAQGGRQAVLLDGGRSSALWTHHPHTQLWTLLRAMDSEDKAPLRRMTARLKQMLPADDMTVVYPDDCDAFRLAGFQSSLRLDVAHTRLVPRSLAAIFTCLGVPQPLPRDGGLVFVIDQNVDGAFCVTPVQGTYAADVERLWPESHGMIWERFPTYMAPASPAAPVPAWDARALRVETQRGKPLTLLDEDMNETTVAALAHARQQQVFSADAAIEQAGERFHNTAEAPVVVALVPGVRTQAGRFVDLSETPLLSGVAAFLAHEREIYQHTDVTLWRDHLPALSIQRLVGSFPLISDHESYAYGTAAEKRIAIGETFTLPKGKRAYRFHLHLEGADGKHVYEAVIRHRAFPLDRDVECRLHMRYRYDADQPYELRFEPLAAADAPFSEAVVTWERAKPQPAADALFPAFPPTSDWEDLLCAPGESGRTRNLLQELERSLAYLVDPVTFERDKTFVEKEGWYYFRFPAEGGWGVAKVSPKAARSFSDEIRARMEDETQLHPAFYMSVGPDKRGRFFSADLRAARWEEVDGLRAVIDVDLDGERHPVVFSKNNFMFPAEFSPSLKNVRFGVQVDRETGAIRYDRSGRIWARDVVDATEPVQHLHIKYLSLQPISQFVRAYYQPLPLLRKLYVDGRTTRTPGGPAALLTKIRDHLQKLYARYFDLDYQDIKAQERALCCFRMFCIAVDDMPVSFYEEAEREIEAREKMQAMLPYDIGFLLSDFTTAEQAHLLGRLQSVQADAGAVIVMLSRAAWRNEAFLRHAPAKVLLKFAFRAMYLLRTQKRSISRRQGLLEYILAIFRLRERKDAAINRKLSLENPKVREFYAWLEARVKTQSFRSFHSRIELDVRQSPEYAAWHIPDFIYALLVYITGEDDASSIVISRITEEEEEE